MVTPMLQLTKRDYSKLAHSSKPLVLTFLATWCRPCSKVSRILDDLSNEYDGRALICKIDIDKERELVEEFRIKGIPTVVFFYRGHVFERITGFKTISEYRQILNRFLDKSL